MNTQTNTSPEIEYETYQIGVAWIVNHQRDSVGGFGTVHLPTAISKKYPYANREFAWRYLFPATHLLQNGYDTQHLRFWAGVRTVQELLGHKDVKTTMIYTPVLSEVEGHALQHGGLAVRARWMGNSSAQ